MKKISVDLWFDDNAQEAVDFYLSVFKDGKVLSTADYPAGAPGQEGTLMYISFEMNGQLFGALNGGPNFQFSPATSLVINCEDQGEVDYYWDNLSAVPEAEQCGWLMDKFGMSWQVVPVKFNELIQSSDAATREKVFAKMMTMKKLDVAELEKAAL